MVVALTPIAIRAAQVVRPRRAAGFLLALRLLPTTLALFLVAGLCVPSYLLLEEEAASEQIGLLCLVLAFFGLVLLSVSVLRSTSAIAFSFRQVREWERSGSTRLLDGAWQPVWVVDSEKPLLAVTGVFHPRLVVSRRVTSVLSAEQLRAALRHEEVHRTERDNLKRLLLLLSPGLLPGLHGFKTLERAWSRVTEWAADDDAVAGNPGLSLSLAAALVRIARMGGTPSPTPLSATFLSDGTDLTQRVDRLLRPETTVPSVPTPRLAIAAVVAAIGAFVLVAVQPITLASAHQLMEYLTH
jgi:Zn-dependent protease with chaperone function